MIPFAGWVGFIIFVIAMLMLDLFVFNRKAHEIKLREALLWSLMWIVLALLFNVGVYFWFGRQQALEFLTGYVLEKSLSIDNLFVFLIIFSYFKIPGKYQHGVLFWGILGALIMRAIFIAGGITLLKYFHWIIYIFGIFLVITGIKMAIEKDKEIHPENSPVLRLFNRVIRVTPGFEEGKFFVRREQVLFATPLFVVLVLIETTDVIFATDSIPAVLAITQKPFIVYTSNVFAILGLRALYFALSGIMQLFHHLHYGLSAILVFVGIKMLVADIFKIPVGVSLSVIVAILAISIAASLRWPKQGKLFN
ncbi:MAG: TerC family protein [Candidatus Omnitrophica bacterium]|nr:TerC family protein [Candidatus Omnitrophota bacterium]